MKISADHHFTIGEQHLKQGKPCQDYAISGEFENFCFAVVSDGCSSGQNTDVGARFTALAARAAAAAVIKNFLAGNHDAFDDGLAEEIDIEQHIIQRGTYRMLGLKKEDMLATCLYLCFSKNSGIAHLLGDGVLAWKSAEGQIVMRRLEWSENAPLYPIYREDNFLAFIKFHGGSIEIPALTMEEWVYTPSSEYEHKKTSAFSIADGIRGHTELFSAERIRNEKIEFVAIFSDGVAQIKNMDWKDIVVEMLSFKTTAGAFTKRRAIRFLKNAYQLGKRPIDDLAYSVVKIEGEPNDESSA